jgi:hypothetical protein
MTATYHVPRGIRSGVWAWKPGAAGQPTKADPSALLGPTVEAVALESDGFDHPLSAELSLCALVGRGGQKLRNKHRLNFPPFPKDSSAWEDLRFFAEKNLLSVGRALRLGRAALNERLAQLGWGEPGIAPRKIPGGGVSGFTRLGYTRIDGSPGGRCLLPLTDSGECLVRLHKHDQLPWGTTLPQKW